MTQCYCYCNNIRNEETFHRVSIVIMKRMLQNYYKNSKKCFLVTSWTLMSSTDSNIQSHTGVLPVAIGLNHSKYFESFTSKFLEKYMFCSVLYYSSILYRYHSKIVFYGNILSVSMKRHTH